LNKRLYIISAVLLISLFLISFTGFGCKETGRESATEITDSEQTDTENAALEESEEGTSNAIEVKAEVIPISVERVYEIISNCEDYVILDVRTPEEFNEGHIEGAMLIPIDTLEGRLNELPKDKPIIMYCKGGASGVPPQPLFW